MVLGLKGKNRRGPSIQIDYIIHVQDIKPWPPTQSLKHLRFVLIQWENGDRNSGSTSSVAPSTDEGKIEFNESFRLPFILSRDMTVKNGEADVFQKNLLEFSLYEPRRDKTVKGQLLGTAIVDLADYGVLKEITTVGVPMNCIRSFRNTAHPVLYLKIQPYEKVRSGSSLRGRLAKEASMEKNCGDSVSALMSEEYADEAEIASSTDDDISSHSLLTVSSALDSNGGSPRSQNKESGRERGKHHTGVEMESHDLASKLAVTKSDISSESESNVNLKDFSSHSRCVEHSSAHGSPNNVLASLSDTSEMDCVSNSENILGSGAKSSRSCQAHESAQQIQEEVANPKSRVNSKSISEGDGSIFSTEVIRMDVPVKRSSENDTQPRGTRENEILQVSRGNSSVKVAAVDDIDDVEAADGDKNEQSGETGQMVDKKRHSAGDESSNRLSLDAVEKQTITGSNSPLSRDRIRHVKSVRSLMDSARSNGLADGCHESIVKQEAKVYPSEKCVPSDRKSQELEQKIKMLEGELMEAAAIEISLYSIVAEHGSSTNKVHAPARRLSRLYFQADKGVMRANAAQSAISGLVVVAKACGNDVPRLTFWLSNCAVLRAIVTEAFVEEQLPLSAGPSAERNGVGKGINKKSSVLKWKVSSYTKKGNKYAISESFQDWEEPHALISALEKVEYWIFSRVVESVWWQTLTPHMQSSAAKVMDKVVDSCYSKNYRTTSSSGDQLQVNFSLELWKKAFKDACERLCPVRAGGHQCGCLPMLAKLIMEQCVSRLDVAMFNAILRESADDIPTDPVSDPISDAKVLPVPAGKSSFGSGAQLKNAIGNWSRWSTDLFGIDDDDHASEDEMDDGDERQNHDSPLNSFCLLKSLSDLMMLPKDMLLNESIRKEVCPKFGAQLIKRVLNNFAPDEFCQDPIPDTLFEVLDSEDILAEGEGSVTSFPFAAPAVFYSPPSPSLLAHIIGGNEGMGSRSQLQRSRSVLRRSNTSDDELDELDSPLNSILGESLQASPTQMRPNWKVLPTPGKHAVRYQLLHEVWDNRSEF